MISDYIDLRSDTVTKPTKAMREAMADAPVGDDQYGEDPSVTELQEYAAHLLGKHGALFVASGTMANQIALKLFTSPGDDVVVGRESHNVLHEAGASAANAGVQFTEIGSNGLFTAEEFRRSAKPRGHVVFPATTLVEVENTHNRGGGLVFPQEEVEKICAVARGMNIATFLDGARLFNASVASGLELAKLAKPFDIVAVSLSKGLGAPVGSILAGEKSVLEKAVRYRRMFGGAMRQCGIIAAGGLYALRHNILRLADDHHNAALIATRVAQSPKIKLDPSSVKTNIIIIHLDSNAPSAAKVVARCKEQGVLLLAFGERTVRLTTHLDVKEEACRRAADILVRAIESN